MKAIPIHEAKANLSKYIAQAKAGKPVYIGSYGRPDVVLEAAPKKPSKQQWGALKGKFWISDSVWDQASASVNKDFEQSIGEDPDKCW